MRALAVPDMECDVFAPHGSPSQQVDFEIPDPDQVQVMFIEQK